MRAFPNGMISQAEVVQLDRWSHGPLEFVFFNRARYDRTTGLQCEYAVHQWNTWAPAGFLRDGEAMDILCRIVPALQQRKNPNLIFVPVGEGGLTTLHVMLASLVPDEYLRRARIQRRRASMSLGLAGSYDLPSTFASAASSAFSAYIWNRLCPQSRMNAAFFSKNAPLRLLSGDTRFWMHRLYRVALDRREDFGEGPTEPDWKPLPVLEAEMREQIPRDEWANFIIRRPLLGGDVWDANDPGERDEVIDEAIEGAGVMDSLQPVIELLHTHQAHEDFSNHSSYIKEDFERRFYSKRARLKVELVETIDDSVTWAVSENDGFGELLLRDIFACLDVRERNLLLAVRMGKRVSEIAADEALSSHASVSRRVERLREKVALLLGEPPMSH